MRTQTVHVPLDRQTINTVERGVPPTASATSQLFIAVGIILGIMMGVTLLLVFLPMSVFVFGLLLFCGLTLALGLAFLLVQYFLIARPRSVRYVRLSGLTWFSQSRAFIVALAVGFSVQTSAFAGYAVFVIVAGLTRDGGGPQSVPRSAWGLSVILTVLAGYLWRETSRALRERRGVRVDSDGLLLNHEHADLRLRWNQLANVRVGAMSKPGRKPGQPVSCVSLETNDGRVYDLEALELGSDPTVVAAFIAYHRDHEQARKWLVDPEDAIRRFRDAQQPSPHVGRPDEP